MDDGTENFDGYALKNATLCVCWGEGGVESLSWSTHKSYDKFAIFIGIVLKIWIGGLYFWLSVGPNPEISISIDVWIA